MSFLERVAERLSDAGLILKGHQPSELDMLEAIEDLIEENRDLSKDHARLECFGELIKEHNSIVFSENERGIITAEVRGGKFPYLIKRDYYKDNLSGLLDMMHKGLHE